MIATLDLTWLAPTIMAVAVLVSTIRNGRQAKANGLQAEATHAEVLETKAIAQSTEDSVNGVPPGSQTIRQNVDKLISRGDATGPGVKEMVASLVDGLEAVKERLEKNGVSK